MENIIKVTNLQKEFKVKKKEKGIWSTFKNIIIPQYETKIAVDNVNFDIKKGERVGFIGANGAGKSTTIKMLTGILYPSNGEILANGYIPYKQREEYVADIGVVFGQKSQLIWDLPVIDSFKLIKKIYRIEENLFQKNLEKYITLLDMQEFINQPVRQLSLGQRMRAELVAALLHNPSILFLDEPTIGLDVVAKKKIRDFIKEINKEKKVTIIFTTHDMRDIEEICNRIIVIDKGKIIFDGTIIELKKKYSYTKKVVVEFANNVDTVDFLNVNCIKIDEKHYEFIFGQEQVDMNEFISFLFEKFNVNDFSISSDIEDVVRNIYKREE